ncbi:MAG TPA: aminotransferase class I/II-fold pyridoxal phosphate-dependent enzyme [Aggregicoccus sp.]|nr:aminotransferase class I/II-fold pyridoxal phosphate-dependent enzyme [Aggregicoccus sp.]
MLDFTSALYLGLQHASSALAPWEQLTCGVPAALREPPESAAVARAVAHLVGLPRALLAPSTLHLFFDVFDALVGDGGAPAVLLWDQGSYPVARWGMERAAARGVPAYAFAHHQPAALQRRLREARGRRALVLTDGFCPGCGRAAPLARYLELLRPHGGLLVLDDTQALGLLGTPAAGSPYGEGGGGSLRHAGVGGGPQVLWCASLAKGFGVPLAVAAGSAPCIGRLREEGETRLHCSPPSLAALHAAQAALALNAAVGEQLRERLARRVRAFRAHLREAGLSATGGAFPVQRLEVPADVEPGALELQLRGRGVRAVLQRGRCGPRLSVSFLLTARHPPQALAQGVAALAAALQAARGSAGGAGAQARAAH